MVALLTRSLGQREADKARYVHRSAKGATGRSYQPSQKLAQRRFGVNLWSDCASSYVSFGKTKIVKVGEMIGHPLPRHYALRNTAPEKIDLPRLRSRLLSASIH